jgi:hypothetical protein
MPLWNNRACSCTLLPSAQPEAASPSSEHKASELTSRRAVGIGLLYRDPQRESHLHALVDGTGAEHHQDGEESERTLFLDAVAIVVSPPPPET